MECLIGEMEFNSLLTGTGDKYKIEKWIIGRISDPERILCNYVQP